MPRALFQTEHMDSSLSEMANEGSPETRCAIDDISSSETLHPILQKIRRRGIVPTIRAQSDLCRVRDPASVRGVQARVARAWVAYIVGSTVPRGVRWRGNKISGLIPVRQVAKAAGASSSIGSKRCRLLGHAGANGIRSQRPVKGSNAGRPRVACDNSLDSPMPKARARRVQSREERPAFDAEAFLESAGTARRVVSYPKGKTVFSQGQSSDAVMYIQKGGIKISVLSRTGKEAVVAMLGRGDFFGEGALTGQAIRIGTATTTTLTTVLIIEKAAMLQLLRDEPTFSERFISYMLARNIRIEADLVDHLFNSSEKRLARALLLLARYGDQAGPERRIPKISQETLAEMIGTTRSRVNFFMNKFRDLGFIEYNGDIKINTSLLSVVLHD